MIRLTQVSLAGLVTAGLAFLQDEAGPRGSVLDGATFATWRDRIRIRDSELVWEQLPWYVTYHEGLEQAGTEGKPLVLWVMNGHPLGCT